MYINSTSIPTNHHWRLQLITKHGIKIKTITVKRHTILGLKCLVWVAKLNRPRPKTYNKLGKNIITQSGYHCLYFIIKVQFCTYTCI